MENLEIVLPDTEAGRRAQLRGLLAAKQKTLTSVEGLTQWGRPLMALVLVTSVFHLFAVLGGVVLPGWAHIIAAVLQVLAVDLLAWFSTSSRSAARTAGLQLGWYGQAVALGLVGSVNASYLLRHTAGLPSWATNLLPVATSMYAGLLMVFVPIAYVAIEGALHKLDAARLRLVRDVEVLREMLAGPVNVQQPEPVAVNLTVATQVNVQQPEPPAIETVTVEEAAPTLMLPEADADAVLEDLLVLEPAEAEKLDKALAIYRETGSKQKAVEQAWGVKKSGSNKTYKRAMQLLNRRLAA